MQEELSFKPSINQNSRKMINQNEKYQQPVQDRLYNKHNEYLLKRQYQKEVNRDQELLGCTFKPNISLTNKSYSQVD